MASIRLTCNIHASLNSSLEYLATARAARDVFNHARPHQRIPKPRRERLYLDISHSHCRRFGTGSLAMALPLDNVSGYFPVALSMKRSGIGYQFGPHQFTWMDIVIVVVVKEICMAGYSFTDILFAGSVSK